MKMQTSISAVLALYFLGLSAAAQDQWPTQKWTMAMPKDVGLDLAVLAVFDADLAQEKMYGYVDSVTIIRHGRVAFDKSYPRDYDSVKFAIDLPMDGEPGAKFNYAFGNAQLLVHFFNKAVGVDMEEYASRHLFAPLGIDRFYWKRTPAGHVDGSGGLYLRPHDLAKIGYMYLHKGRWDGKQIVTAEWVADSVNPHSDATEKMPGLKWGYAWGILSYGEKGRHTLFGNGGFGGQGMLVLPDHDAVIVYTGWNAVEDLPKLMPQAVIDRFLRAISENTQDGK